MPMGSSCVGSSTSMNIHGDNISNVNTNGFKANRAHFAALLYQDHRGVEEELPMGVGTSLLMTSTDCCWAPTAPM